jgi:hypothetical protein
MPAQLTKAVSLVLVVCASVFLTGCASDLTTLRSVSSPDGQGSASVVMEGPSFFGNQFIRVEVLYHGKRHIVFQTEPQGDLDDCFVAVGWSPDSSLVGFFLRPCYANSVLIKGYDSRRDISVPEAQLQDILREAIRKDFAFKPGRYGDPYPPMVTFISDPLVWATTPDAQKRYALAFKGEARH